jgi:AraC-like DNA-binding protein
MVTQHAPTAIEPVAAMGAVHSSLRDLVSGTAYVARGEILEAARPQWVPARVSLSLNLNIGDVPDDFPVAYATSGRLYSYGVARGPVAVSWIGLRLTPLGAYRILGRPVSEVSGRIVDLADLFGRPGAELVERMRSDVGWAGRFRMLEDFLLSRAERNPGPAPEVAEAWERLAGSGGRVSIGELARETGWSHKHLISKFTQQIGVAPKRAARMVRFEAAARRLRRDRRAAWEEAMAACGYYDLSHVYRDCREFTGTTPGGLLVRTLPCGCLASAALGVPFPGGPAV